MFVENVERSCEHTRNERIIVFTGAGSVQIQLVLIFRSNTLYQPVASMPSHDHNWALCMNRHEVSSYSADTIEVDRSSIDPVSYKVD